MKNIPKRLILILAGVTAIGLSTQGANASGQQDYLQLLDDYAEEIEVAAAPPQTSPIQRSLSVTAAAVTDTGKVLRNNHPASTSRGTTADVTLAQFEDDLRDLHPASYHVYSALAPYEQRRVYTAFLRDGLFDDAIRAIRTSINAHND